MLYREHPYYSVYMLRNPIDTKVYPLPKDYDIVMYQKGDEKAWSDIQIACGHVDHEEMAYKAFEKAFSSHLEQCEKRLYFVRHKSGEYVATIALWFEDVQGVRYERLHWLGVKDTHNGKGIAKALVSRVCQDCQKEMYLSTQSWSYPAIHIYEEFGFEPWNPYHREDDEEAWHYIYSILHQ